MIHVRVLLTCVIAIGLFCHGCKKEGAPSEETNAAAISSEYQPAYEKEFLSDPDVVTAKLERTTISKLDLPKDFTPSFFLMMENKYKTHLRQAEITLANQPFKVFFGGLPDNEFFLYDVQRKRGSERRESWSLDCYQKIEDKFFKFMLVERDSKITARPYKGKLGVLKVGKGDRKLKQVYFSGLVHQKGNVTVPIELAEQIGKDGATEAGCKIPVGDYRFYDLTVQYDNLLFQISNYHIISQDQPQGWEMFYKMQVCEDKPYVLDFSNKPKVVFDEPPMEYASCSRGYAITFATVLIDPKLDMMIHRLDDLSVRVDKELKDEDGRVFHTYKDFKSLEPKVVITRSDGEVVAEGVMPFG